MTIETGNRIPEVTVQRIGEGVENLNTRTLFEDRRVLLFGVPGAFTPTCSERHLPGYVANLAKFRERGVDVACMSVNDPFVMQAWAKSVDAPAELMMLADGNAEFTRALGLDTDASAYGMGTRSRRFAMLVDHGVVKRLEIEAPGEYRVSSAEHMLSQLD
ncbi:peroxiredoxin [Cognatilysobacter bugurensis]|uniref:Glutathione-dependent peroxiredoxin n=1 Tax=Cognatilysobacter bugurensis TaxID=543356 RepID=A0A918W6N3_9GAMM|nr:peroxiredoxin [Lysobacter bugurensis]GHA71527.1 peroxiredoxin [Lysobacter bugurensis]